MINNVNFVPNVQLRAEIKNNIEEKNCPQQNDVENCNMQGTQALASYNMPLVKKDVAKGEKFADVYNECAANMPDRTSTVEEKTQVLSYIDRMLNCKDITPEAKNYWSNKKTIIKNEILAIQNSQNIGSDSDYNPLEKEFKAYAGKEWGKKVEFESEFDKIEYWFSYYKTCVSYADRILSSTNITPEKQEEYNSIREDMMHGVRTHGEYLSKKYCENRA
ncbi:hypothetical protein IJE86_04600 [bacterium]|nr:hypothetical protein [bacterium]